MINTPRAADGAEESRQAEPQQQQIQHLTTTVFPQRFRELLVSKRRLERVGPDIAGEGMAGLRDLDSGEVFVTDRKSLENEGVAGPGIRQ